ncbi:MAG TPA: ABC transporter substrate-binding protein [Rhodopila sp.]|uniref:ABC transporter substrate-binding protein n=1 Tax=Rhodopila sp. TaxID=2480087 RepID=UPI002C96F667|nr:ABC transporter substrate-binding protein [Rhodopila sp.]HVY14041.1 ABC transporter substrate-binding protein [Rhodopila sp.]
MRRTLVASFGAIATILASMAATRAEPFKCPVMGGDLTFGQEANINTLDQMTSSTISTRNIAMNIYESLMTRDENNHPILELADSMTESPDHLTYTFKLRQGIHFHNGKLMTSADVVASFDRYAKVGNQRSTLDNVARWDAPDANTFVIHMKRVQPTFIEALSSFSVPIVIIPSEDRDVPAQQLTKPVGTGPFQLVESVPGSYVKLKRFEGYKPNTSFQDRTGFGGYKQACLDTVTFRIVTEPGARVAGLKTGELQAVEDIPAKSAADLKSDKNIIILPLKHWWIQIANPNTSNPPTDNLMVRKAIQAVLDMDEIMDAASDGNYDLNVGFQYPNQPDYTDAGKETYNLHDPALAKKYLAEAGYKGEPVVLLTNKDYPSMYNAALVMQQQLQAVGINAQMKVVDWPTSVQMSLNTTQGWNFHFTGWGTQPALGALATMQFLVQPNATYKPKDGKDDPDVLAAWNDMNTLPTAKGRQDAYARMQKLVLDRVYAIPFGSLTKLQAVRANVHNFVPFRIPRMSNVWMSH